MLGFVSKSQGKKNRGKMQNCKTLLRELEEREKELHKSADERQVSCGSALKILLGSENNTLSLANDHIHLEFSFCIFLPPTPHTFIS